MGQGVAALNIFLLNLLLIVAWRLAINPSKDEQRRSLFILIVTAQLFIITFLSPIVSDAVMYADWARMDMYGNTNVGWKWLSKICWAVWPNAKMLLATVSAISLTAAAHFIKRHSVDPFLSYIVYICMGFWSYTFFVFRQSVAFAVCMFAYDYLEAREDKKFIVTVLVASLFHETALAFLIALPFYRMRRGNCLKLYLEFLCAVAFLFFYKPILELFLSGFRNGWLYGVSESADGYGLLVILAITLVATFVLDRDNRESLYQKNIELGVLAQILALHLPELVRLVHYFDMSMIIAIPSLVANERNARVKKALYALILVALLGIYIFSVRYGFPGGPEAYVVTLP